MFDALIVQPVFNLLVIILALIPGHNFGLAIILFTICIRLLLWPLIKKQLHQAKLMKRIQPELKRIAQETKGDAVKRQKLQMELYKERGINPFQNIGLVLLQLPILIALFVGLQRVIKDPKELINFAYGPVRDLPWIQQLADNIKTFDSTLFGVVDLYRSAIGDGFYFPAFLIVVLSAVVQYYQAKQLTPIDKDARKLKDILKEAGEGKQADQTEVSAAIGRYMLIFLPAMVFIFTIGFASALSLYMLTSAVVAFIQQSIVLRDDTKEMSALSEPVKKDVDAIPEAEVVPTAPHEPKPLKKKSAKSKKRRRR